MITIQYILEGDPTPLARPRANFTQKRMYDSQSQLKLITGLTLRQQHGSYPLLEGPILLSATFYMPFPSSMSKAKQNISSGLPSYARPDLDNLVKWICDCANTICYADDAAIAIIQAKKVYDANPRTEFNLTEMDDEYMRLHNRK